MKQLIRPARHPGLTQSVGVVECFRSRQVGWLSELSMLYQMFTNLCLNWRPAEGMFPSGVPVSQRGSNIQGYSLSKFRSRI